MRNHVIYISFLLFICIFSSYAQDQRISIKVKSQPIYQILEQLENSSDYTFIYDANAVNVNDIVSIDMQNKSFFEVLNTLFKNSGIAYTVINNQIILSKIETAHPSQQSAKTTSGVITDTHGEPIIGVNIWIKGTSHGTVTNLYGEFQLNIPLDSTIIISYIGYITQEIVFTGQKLLHIELAEDVLSLDEVVVTALGIRKKEASLPYATQLISNNQFSVNKDNNLINTLAGKTAGMQISRSSSGLGGSAKVSIRGNRSISGNNQPLYVIDGVPILNSSNEQPVSAIGGTANAANRDGGDGVSNLNQDDIESINVLKGASASALYGSQAANGVILITTRKGLANQRKITFSSNVTVNQVTDVPKMQNTYGKTEWGRSSWGEVINQPVYDHVNNFFNDGINTNHSLSVATGSEFSQTYFSYANITAKGNIDNNNYYRHNLNFHETAKLFNNRLTLNGNVNLIKQKTNNKPTSGGLYMNPLVGLYTFPRGMDMSAYKNNYEIHDEERNIPSQNWPFTITDYDQNPYWLINRAKNTDKRTRMIAFLTAGVKVTDWFSIQGRGSVDYIDDKYIQEIYATTSPAIAGNNGRYIDYSYQETQIYGDLIATFDKSWGKLNFNGIIGGSISDNKTNSLRLDSNTASLYYPNVFTVSNINMSTNAYIEEQIDAHRQLQSIFSMIQLGYSESLYLTMTARNDWSSTLAYTKSEEKGFFYPSFGTSWVINQMIQMPQFISYAKLRSSWSKVGNDLPLFVSNTVAHIVAGGSIQPNDTAPFDDLKPEMNNSFEIGTEWRFFSNRLHLDFSWYKTNTKNQLFTLPSPAGAEYKFYYVNAGNIQNKGVELMLGVVPFLKQDFIWKSTVNFSHNKNIVKKLHEDLPSFIYGDEGFSSSYSMRIREGGSFGDIYGKAFRRDENGAIEYDQNGIPLSIGDGNTEKVGNCNPDFMLGWNNTFTYKDFSLSFLIDGRFGGEILSQTQAILDQYGVSKKTGEARQKGYVSLEGNNITNIKDFYEQIGGRNGVTEYYMYDATNIRLREMSIGYSFPQKWIKQLKIFDEIQLSLVGRNLFFFYIKAPSDPDAVFSTDNNNQGIDIFGMPSTRSIGFNLKVSL